MPYDVGGFDKVRIRSRPSEVSGVWWNDEGYLICHYRSLNVRSPVQGTVFSYRFIERCQSEVMEKILRHCGLWIETPSRAPPVELPVPPQQFAGPTLDFAFVVTTGPQWDVFVLRTCQLYTLHCESLVSWKIPQPPLTENRPPCGSYATTLLFLQHFTYFSKYSQVLIWWKKVNLQSKNTCSSNISEQVQLEPEKSNYLSETWCSNRTYSV